MPIVRLENLQQFAAVNFLSDPGAVGGPKIIPSCLEVGLLWNLTDGRVAHNVMYGRYAAPPTVTPALAQSVFAALQPNAEWTALAAFMPTTGAFAGVTLREVSTANNPVVQSTGAAVPGTSVSTAIPDEVALVVTLRTAKTGPSGRGRIYIPNWATNALGTGGTASAATVTALQNWVGNRFTGAFAAAGLTRVLGLPARIEYIGSTGTVHPARAAGSVDVTGMVVRNNTWDSQRRRGLR
jgi:hypothetical protein